MKIIIWLTCIIYAIGGEERKTSQYENLGTVIGVDLGTSYTCVGVYRNGRVDIIPNDEGNKLTPSYVAFTADGHRLFGNTAKSQLTQNPTNTIFDIKRIIGKDFNDETVQNDIKNFPFLVVNQNYTPTVVAQIGDVCKTFTPEEISAMLLTDIKASAEAFLKEEITRAVITVPANFNGAQRQATKDAGMIAGLFVLRIINQPTAAAIAYGFDKKENESYTIVFSLGGGSCDVSLLTIENGVFQVAAVSGDSHLGGEDFNHRVMSFFINLFITKYGGDINISVEALQKLRREVERAKRDLSYKYEVHVEIKSFYESKDFSETLTRSQFEELNIDLFRLTIKQIEKVLQDSKFQISRITEILLVGGSTKIPKIQQLVKSFFNGKEPCRTINPDYAIAIGAAIQASIIKEDSNFKDILLLDVCSMSLGIATKGGSMTKIISRNTPIPTKVMQIFRHSPDTDKLVNIQVFEGESEIAKNNYFLGNLVLTGIPVALRNKSWVEVTFDMNVNGIIEVSAKDGWTRNQRKIVIQRERDKFSYEAFDRLMTEARLNANKDKSEKERKNVKNELEKFVYSIKRKMVNNDKLLERMPSIEKEDILNRIERMIGWLDRNSNADVESLKKHHNQFEKDVTRIMKEVTEK